MEVYTDAYLNNAAIFEFNLENAILAKKEVRHALAHAIDRNFINDAIFFGTAKPAGSNIPAVFSTYNDEKPFTYPFDLAKANELLDKAGILRARMALAFRCGSPFCRPTSSAKPPNISAHPSANWA